MRKGPDPGVVPRLAQGWGHTENPGQHVGSAHLRGGAEYIKYRGEEWAGKGALNTLMISYLWMG